MEKLFEVSIGYTDGSDELQLLTAHDYADAMIEAEGWIDYKKDVKELEIREVRRRK